MNVCSSLTRHDPGSDVRELSSYCVTSSCPLLNYTTITITITTHPDINLYFVGQLLCDFIPYYIPLLNYTTHPGVNQYFVGCLDE